MSIYESEVVWVEQKILLFFSTLRKEHEDLMNLELMHHSFPFLQECDLKIRQ